MPQSQPDHGREVQGVLQMINHESVPSFDITNPFAADHQSFVPRLRVEDYFQRDKCSKTSKLLHEVLGQHSRISAQSVAQNCCRVFCILALLRKTHWIAHFAHYRALWDQHLPFPTKHAPPHFPIDTSDPDFFKNFVQKQRYFCTPPMGQSNDDYFESEDILPITGLSRVAGGYTSTVYRAVIHDEYDQISPDTTPSHCYAIKTYRRRNAQSEYETESNAFKQITEAGLRGTAGIIAFYAGFEYKGTFNILLEYAEGGTLEDYFMKEENPSDGDGIINFWQSLFETVKGVYNLHEHRLPLDQTATNPTLLGWHRDLKPTNILLVGSNSGSRYQRRFKIADFGNSHFKTIMEGQSEAAPLSSAGTRTYGAPECYAPSELTESRRSMIDRKADIWSLGCIYSEAAAWTVNGWRGLEQYRQARKDATARIHDFRGGDCFHDGERKLDAVHEQHEELRPDFHTLDFITGQVIDSMINGMLANNPHQRPDAAQLDSVAETVVMNAKGRLQKANKAAIPAQMDHDRGSPTPILHEREKYSQSPESTVYEQNNDANPWAPSSAVSKRPSVSQEQSRSVGANVRAKNTRHRNSKSVDSTDAGSPRPTSALAGQFEDLDLKGERSQHQRNSSLQPGRQIVDCPLECGARIREMDAYAHMDQCPKRLQSRSHDTPPRAKGMEPISKVTSAEIPHCSTVQAWTWYHKRKHGKRGTELPHNGLMGELEGRDHVFIIDDSNTMRPYWEEATDLAKLLTYMTKKMDPDGVDMYVLSSSKRHKVSDATTMSNALRQITPSAITNLDTRLDDELRRYAKDLDRYHDSHGTVFGMIRPKLPRKRSIYVLTDGKLEGGIDKQGQEAIKAIAKKLADVGLPRGQIGVQFISFGKDPDGLRRLRNLDHLNKEMRMRLDVVDTEPSKGNIWKMLLGAINAKFDDDEEEEESGPVDSRLSSRSGQQQQ